MLFYTIEKNNQQAIFLHCIIGAGKLSMCPASELNSNQCAFKASNIIHWKSGMHVYDET
jgi:hypothetical protein